MAMFRVMPLHKLLEVDVASLNDQELRDFTALLRQRRSSPQHKAQALAAEAVSATPKAKRKRVSKSTLNVDSLFD